MKNIIDWLRIVAAVVLLGTCIVVVWKFKWILLGAVAAYVVIVMACNYCYRKATGKNMGLYTRIFKN